MSNIDRETIRPFMAKRKNIERMKTATDRGRPAVEPLQKDLLTEFGPGVRENSVKQRIGRMAREIMGGEGYEHDKYGVRVEGDLFTCASLYKKKKATIGLWSSF